MSSICTGARHLFVQHIHADPVSNSTDDTANSWMGVDLKTSRLVPDHYALRHDVHPNGYVLRNWELQASNDNETWSTLRRHSNDPSLADGKMSVAAWPLEAATVNGRSFRYFRILQTDRTSNNCRHLMCSGIELYGLLEV